MLNLEGLTVEKVNEIDGDYVLDVLVHTQAPTCDCLFPKVVRNGRKKAGYVDTPMHGKRVEIVVKRQMYICQNCHRPHPAEIPHMHEKHRMTLRCYAYITREGAKRSWKALAQEIGVDAQTISDIWNAWADAELAKVQPLTPNWMGIDELFIMGKYRAVITNVREKALVTMLPSRDIGTLQAYFIDKFEAPLVQVVTMDMWQPYRDAVRTCFPKAKIVVDRFHVMQHASKAVETVRIAIRRQLDKQRRVGLLGDRYLFLSARENLSAMQTLRLEAVLEQYPTIRDAYRLKESFRDVWQTGSREEAERACEEWKKRVAASPCADAFKPLCTALTNWHTEIFAFMDWKLTNAYTESFNALARRMDRTGNGYSFEALKKRLIMSHGLQFRYVPKPCFNFPLPKGPPADIPRLVRRMYPHATRHLIGFRLSTLAKLAPKLPEF